MLSVSKCNKDDGLRALQLGIWRCFKENFSKPSDFWNSILDGESSTLLDSFEMLMLELRPLCEQFHAYIKDQTRQNYSSSLILFKKPYPQHLAEVFISNAYKPSGNEKYMNLPYRDPAYNINITEGLQKAKITRAFENFLCAKIFFKSMDFLKLQEYLLRSAQTKSITET
ncbi:angiotensin-converting enzyme-like isoform 1-T8 [Glossina fuscipes fuscipes]